MKQITFAFLIGLFLIVSITLPVWWQPTKHLYGYSGDAFGFLGHLAQLKDESVFRGGVFVSNTDVPFGSYFSALREILALTPVAIMARIASDILAYNFWVLLTFPLAVVTMFILLRLITRSFWPSLWGGIVFAFAPYYFWHSFTHISLAQVQWMPLFILALLKFDMEPSRRRAFWLVLAFFLVFFTTFYYGYFMLLMAVAFFLLRMLYDLLYQRRRYLTRERLVAFLWVFGFGLVFAVVPSFLAFKDYQNAQAWSVGKTVYQRDFEQLLYLSARPWDYLLPSVDNPILGRISQTFRSRLHIWESNLARRNFFWIDVGNLEGTLFLGFTPLILALYAVKKRKKSPLRKEITIFALLALLAFFFSLPPFIEIGNFKLVLPSMLLSWITLVFRTIARWGVVVLLFVAILAAIGLDLLLKKIKLDWQRKLITLATFVLIGVEFINIPPFHFTDVSRTPAEYEWLAGQPGDVVIAEYELDDNMALFFQRVHSKKLLARYIRERTPLYDPESQGKLRKYSVKYVLFHRRSPFPQFNPTNERAPVGQILDPPPAMEEYQKVFETKDTLVYEL